MLSKIGLEQPKWVKSTYWDGSFFLNFKPPPHPKVVWITLNFLYHNVGLYNSSPKNISLTPQVPEDTLSAPLERTQVIRKFSRKKLRQYANFTYLAYSRPIFDSIFELYAPFYLLEKSFWAFFLHYFRNYWKKITAEGGRWKSKIPAKRKMA